MLTQSHDLPPIDEDAAPRCGVFLVGLIAATDWMTIGLWAGGSFVAVSLLAAAMNRRRAALVESLRKHVSETIGPVGDEAAGDNPADGSDRD
jgi:hypothetical protein